MITIEEFDFFLTKITPYEEKIVSVIDSLHRQIFIDNFYQLKNYENNTIKLESMERYNKTIYEYCKNFKHNGPITCHVFRSFENSKSFIRHIDPCDVFLYVSYGQKNMIIQEDEIILKAGDSIFIPKNTPHQALNKKESLMLSFGLEDFFVDRI